MVILAKFYVKSYTSICHVNYSIFVNGVKVGYSDKDVSGMLNSIMLSSKIKIGRVNDVGMYYIGRGSVWGNPYTVEEYGRENAIALYKKYFYNVLYRKDWFFGEIEKLTNTTLKDGLILGCYCSPKLCHGEIIKDFITEYIKENLL